MTQKNNRNYAEQITLGCLAINKPLSFVKTIFLNREQNENHYIFNAQKETSLEIRFESSTLTCLFDSNKMCKGAFLFLDDTMELIHYIDYCSKTYPCDRLLEWWMTQNTIIQINIDTKECSLLIVPIRQNKGS